MPELPDVTAYITALEKRIAGATLIGVRRNSPFLLRTVTPPLAECFGRRVTHLRRLGKRIAIGFDNDLWLVLHLMIAGRLHWTGEIRAKIPQGKNGLAAFDFSTGTLTLTEAGTKKRAALHVAAGQAGLAEHNPGGLELADASLAEFREALRRENHTLKRSLTDPTLFSGIGNAYSDEILHRARLSPIAMSTKMSNGDIEALFDATRTVMAEWIARLSKEAENDFPEKVTAFRPEMAVHGRYGKPCPVCGTLIQRIRYADNETNYCPRCQTDGKLLADRALSRLLKSDWPKTIEELERRRAD
ncbi:MAG: fpg2 [Rhodospirillales bacterium]|nr:fpg2 [Rhodospirillales bacterium]